MSKISNRVLKLRAGISFLILSLILFALVIISVPVYAGVNKASESKLSNQAGMSNEEAPSGPYGDWNDEEMDETVSPQKKPTDDVVSRGRIFPMFAELKEGKEDSSGYGDADPEDNS